MRGFTYLEDQTWIDREMTRGSDLPISLSQAKRVTQWLKRNYGPKIEAVTKDTPFPPHIICAITCQETAYFWLKMSDTMKADEVLARCVLDASGEMPSDPRSAFPRNTDAFRGKYGDDFADMLIEEANKTRTIRGMSPKEWVYKGYGIFQYDLQAVVDDKEFFHEKQWYDIDACLARVVGELKHKWARTNDLWASVKAYNGSGPRADQYRRNVQKFAEVTEEVWQTAPGPDPAPVAPPAPIVVAVTPPAPAAAPAPAPVATPAPGPAPSPTPAAAIPAPAATPPASSPGAPVAAPAPAAAPIPVAPAATSSPAVAAVQPTSPAPAAAIKPLPETPMV